MSSESRKPSGLALDKNKCPDCGYLAPAPSLLTIHRRVHSGDRPFACPLCDVKFTQKGSRDKHVRQVHHNADRVTCSWSGCDTSFACADTMRMHVSAVHLETRFACPVAGCAFTSGWKKYITTRHKHSHKGEALCLLSLDAASDPRFSPTCLLTDKRCMRRDASLAVTKDATIAPRDVLT